MAEKKAVEILQTYTGKKNVRLTPRGNFAIFAALHLAKRLNNKATMLIPDQGGWISFEKYSKQLGFFVEKVKTNHGLIDLSDLKEKLRLQNASALIITSLAGYFAEQDLEEIHNMCKNHNCILIEDATGIISKKVHGDIIVGSFGDWKPVNVGYGGFIASNYALESIDDIFSLSKTNFDYSLLIKKLKGAKKRIEKLEKKCAQIKKDLSKFDIIFPQKKGLNVVLRFQKPDDKEKLITYCKKKNYEYVLCPKEIRVLDFGISIEVKRID